MSKRTLGLVLALSATTGGTAFAQVAVGASTTGAAAPQAAAEAPFEAYDKGYPPERNDAVKKFSGVVEGIYFDKAKASVRVQSRLVLQNAATVLKEYPSISLEIAGHTSSDGDPLVNQRLSQARADAEAGREKNRRIEFKVLQ